MRHCRQQPRFVRCFLGASPGTRRSYCSDKASVTPRKKYGLVSASAYRPMDKDGVIGGMDHHFFSNEYSAVGIFDGIGEFFAKPSKEHLQYSGYLSEMVHHYVGKRRLRKRKSKEGKKKDREEILEELGLLGMEPKWTSNLTLSLQKAFEHVQEMDAPGESTVLFMMLEQSMDENEKEQQGGTGLRLDTAVLGASSFLVIRDGRKYYRATKTMYDFNQPYYMASRYDWESIKMKLMLKSLDVKEGDVIVSGSDGLFYNMYDNQIVDVINLKLQMFAEEEKEKQQEEETMKNNPFYDVDMKEIAEEIAQEAHLCSLDANRVPFADYCEESGQGAYVSGGKPDDITVVISRVVEVKEEDQPSPKD